MCREVSTFGRYFPSEVDTGILGVRRGLYAVKSNVSDSVWKRVSWPWEIEFLTLLMVGCAVAGPLLLGSFFDPGITEVDPEAYRPLNELAVRQSFLGGAFVLLLYVAHLYWASSTTEFITVSASHLLAPTLFCVTAYLRISHHNLEEGLTQTFFNGVAWEFCLVLASIQGLTWVLARNRMNRCLKHFEGERWEISEKSRADLSHLKLILARIQPLFYPPRRFRASREGILIEGFSYVAPIPFSEIERVFMAVKPQLPSPGTYLARTSHDLVGLKLFEEADPIFISPEEPVAFHNYCVDRVTVLSY